MSSDAIRKENPLRGARILIVGRDYFFYTREITDELRSSFGAEVAFHPIEPPSYAYRLLKKTGFPLNWWLRRHHERVIAGTRDKAPQIVLFIQVHQIGNMVAKYREAFGSARFVLYYWDSLKTHDYRAFVRYFDKVFTFDRADATQMPGLNYLPLFFPDSFRRLREERDVIYDMSFVGVAVTVKRYDQLVKLRSWAKSSGISLFDYIVVSPALFVRRLLHGQLLHGVHFRSLCERDLMRIYGSSRAVLDLPNNVQSGYTMRTFESLGAHRKLITFCPCG